MDLRSQTWIRYMSIFSGTVITTCLVAIWPDYDDAVSGEVCSVTYCPKGGPPGCTPQHQSTNHSHCWVLHLHSNPAQQQHLQRPSLKTGQWKWLQELQKYFKKLVTTRDGFKKDKSCTAPSAIPRCQNMSLVFWLNCCLTWAYSFGEINALPV